ncbi:interleukin-18-binding protein isoform 1-T1 [Ara ararauna]
MVGDPHCGGALDAGRGLAPGPRVLVWVKPRWRLVPNTGTRVLDPDLAMGTPPARLLLSLLCWALTSRCTGAMALQPPSITLLRPPARPPRPGDSVTARCEALSTLPDLTLIYWLGNGSFVEQLPPAGAAQEGPVLEEPRGAGTLLRRDLRLEPFCARHSRTAFSCVVLSPLGARSADLRWPPARG